MGLATFCVGITDYISTKPLFIPNQYHCAKALISASIIHNK